MEFVHIDLFCKKLNVYLVAHDFIICTKKKLLFKTENKANEPLKVKVTQKKETPVK